VIEDPANTAQGRSRTGDPVDEPGGMQAGLSQSQCMVQPVNRHRSVYIVDLVPCRTDFFNGRKEDFLVRKNSNNKFFNCHTYLAFCSFYSVTGSSDLVTVRIFMFKLFRAHLLDF